MLGKVLDHYLSDFRQNLCRNKPLSQAGKIMLNTIGASHWSIAGQYIKWNVKVDKSGL